MILQTGQFSFHSINLETLEMVRQWRNKDIVRNNMINRNVIRPQQQHKWFCSVRNIHNIYFISNYKNTPFGVNNLKNIDYDKEIAEAGVFVGNEEFLYSEITLIAAFYLLYFSFHALGLRAIKAQTLKNNIKAKAYSQEIGYSLVSSKNDVQWWQISKEDLNKKSEKIILAARALFNFNNEWKLTMVKDDVEIGFFDVLKTRLEKNNVKHSVNKNESEIVFNLSLQQPV